MSLNTILARSSLLMIYSIILFLFTNVHSQACLLLYVQSQWEVFFRHMLQSAYLFFFVTEVYPVLPMLLPSVGCGLPCIWLPAALPCRSSRWAPGCSRAGAESPAAAPLPGTPPPWCFLHRTSGRTSCFKRKVRFLTVLACMFKCSKVQMHTTLHGKWRARTSVSCAFCF